MSESNVNASTRRPDGSHRVVITGMGAVSPAGVGVQALWDAVMGCACCIGPIERFDTTDYDVHIAAEVRDFDATEHGLSKKEARRFERFVQYAIVASDEALAQSGLDLEVEDATRIACVFGTGIGGIDELQSGFFTLNEKGPKRVSPLFIPTMIGNIAAGNLSIRYGLKGECLNVVTACATGAHSIGAAVRDIRHGYIDAALAGGSEESVSPICLAGFANLGALSKEEDPAKASLPFDARRTGFVAGEGAGAVVLESLEHALARGAHVLAEVTGFGSTGDAYHMTAPEPSGEGVARAMRQALAEGGFAPEDLGHLNAHGTGTPANDATESKALLALCGEEAGRTVPVTSVKGTTGHTLGAAGAIEAIVTALSVMNDCVPPTCGFAEADPECPVNVVVEAKTGYPQKVALSNSLGFGGHNASLAISPYRVLTAIGTSRRCGRLRNPALTLQVLVAYRSTLPRTFTPMRGTAAGLADLLAPTWPPNMRPSGAWRAVRAPLKGAGPWTSSIPAARTSWRRCCRIATRFAG